MDSFHRSDWIGVAQALGGMLAVVAAFVVSSRQSQHAAKLRRMDSLERLGALGRLVQLARFRVEDYLDAVMGTAAIGGLKFPNIEIVQSVDVAFEALASASIEDAPSADALEALLDAKTAARHARAFIPDLASNPAGRFMAEHETGLRVIATRLSDAEEGLREEYERMAESI